MTVTIKKLSIIMLTLSLFAGVAYQIGSEQSDFDASAAPTATYEVTFDGTNGQTFSFFDPFGGNVNTYERMLATATPTPSLNPKTIILNTRLESTAGNFPVKRKLGTDNLEASIGNAYGGKEIINIRYLTVYFSGTAPTLSVANEFPWKNQGSLVSGQTVTNFTDESNPKYFNIYFGGLAYDTQVTKIVIGYDC